MEIRLQLHDPEGGAPLYCLATWSTSGIELTKIQGDSPIALAWLPVYNPDGGMITNIAVDIHDDGTVDIGSAVPPYASSGVIHFETPNQDNSLQRAVTITGAVDSSRI